MKHWRTHEAVTRHIDTHGTSIHAFILNLRRLGAANVQSFGVASEEFEVTSERPGV